jgi:hypothetical protein
MHELGHGLGMIHTHQIPALNNPVVMGGGPAAFWREPQLIQYYLATLGGTVAGITRFVQSNITSLYAGHLLPGPPPPTFDAASIMTYGIDGYFNTAHFDFNRNLVLSALDKLQLVGYYPPALVEAREGLVEEYTYTNDKCTKNNFHIFLLCLSIFFIVFILLKLFICCK